MLSDDFGGAERALLPFSHIGESSVDYALLSPQRTSAAQQPLWEDMALVRLVRQELAARPGLVDARSLQTFRTVLAGVAASQAYVVQAGDCAEDPAECSADDVARKVGLLDVLAGVMKMITRKPVVRAARIAGQYGKPRSQPTERISDIELPVYRGHMVNSPEPNREGRRPDPWRLLAGYRAASEVMSHLGWRDPSQSVYAESPVWTSHEALLLDYEIPMLRPNEEGRFALTSTHWPWVGERTRQIDGAHVALLADVINPVACKVGPRMQAAELLALCERLDPYREPGRLTLIARMGAEVVTDLLPPLVRVVQTAGHPVIWLVDPMHANTVATSDGVKTRFVDTLIQEVTAFQAVVRAAGGTAGGIHLETTPEDVTECVSADCGIERISEKYTTFCDPRLNPGQAVSVISAWSA